MAQDRTIVLPESLCADVEKWMQGRFESLDALLIFLLQEIVHNVAKKMDEAEEQIVEQRLKELGYI